MTACTLFQGDNFAAHYQDWSLRILPPNGLACEEGGPLTIKQGAPHSRYSAPPLKRANLAADLGCQRAKLFADVISKGTNRYNSDDGDKRHKKSVLHERGSFFRLLYALDLIYCYDLHFSLHVIKLA